LERLVRSLDCLDEESDRLPQFLAAHEVGLWGAGRADAGTVHGIAAELQVLVQPPARPLGVVWRPGPVLGDVDVQVEPEELTNFLGRRVVQSGQIPFEEAGNDLRLRSVVSSAALAHTFA
jgi:hypothetical protein